MQPVIHDHWPTAWTRRQRGAGVRLAVLGLSCAAGLAGCSLDPLLLAGRACAADGSCADGWTCQLHDRRCVPLPGQACAPSGFSLPCGFSRGSCGPGSQACADGRWGACSGTLPRAERCDGADDDCDGLTDEDFQGLGQPCPLPGGVWACALDGSSLRCLVGAPGEEICDGHDNDGDGQTDELDADGDGYSPCGFGGAPVDCDDGASDSYPGAPERCDGRDNDCDGLTDIGFVERTETCAVGVGACHRSGTLLCVAGQLRCPFVPGDPSLERCDGLDNDCDGDTDEDFPEQGQECAAGRGACRRTALWQCQPGGLLVCPAVAGTPAPEQCDGLDHDCDGWTDDVDADGDYHFACPRWQGTLRWDCDDGDQQIHAQAPEICNGIDDDCSSDTPDGAADPRLLLACDGPDSDLCWDDSYTDCQGGELVCATGPSALEGRLYPGTCDDGLDNDCDGASDWAEDECWWDHAWPHRARLTFANNQAANLDGFPVLVVLSSATIPGFSHTSLQGAGQDLRFVDSDDATLLAYEIERFNSAGVSHLWVRVPRIDASSTSDHIWLYWGNAAAPAGQDAAAVWGSDYRAVWHLTSASASLPDSSGRANHLTGANTAGIAGRLAGGQDFNGTNAYASSAAAIGIAGAASRTVTFWARVDTAKRCSLVGWGSNATLAEFYAGLRGATPAWYLWFYGGGNDWATGVAPTTGAWAFHAITYDGATARWYINDAELGAGFAKVAATTDSALILGREIDGALTSWFDGALDEVRVASGVRPRAWLAAQYRSDTGALVSYGPLQSW